MRSMQKKQKVFVQAAGEADGRKHAGWAHTGSLQRCLKVLQSLFLFLHLASASLVMKQPKGGETAQAKGH